VLKALRVRINGIVQGVGFRPFVYRLALETGVKGYVLNDTEGVTIEVEGKESDLTSFVNRLKTEFPPLAVIQDFSVEEVSPKGYSDFVIKKSKKTEKKFTFIPPDTNICSECLRELFDEKDRRYHYPFIVCTHCGPRFSIVKDIPYDRENTSMAKFEMCDACKKEYEDPLDRRFHTQPVACPRCGPKIYLYSKDKTLISQDTDDVVRKTYELLKAGKILAIKGVGGYHLACDATNTQAVAELRKRKKRPFKPFALMMSSIEKVESILEVSPAEKEVLLSKERPIVLLKVKANSELRVSPLVAPSLSFLGVMLPYAPFHYLLFSLDEDMILVMTSGNLSDEPICYEDEDAFNRLGHIADYFVTYDREIVAHSDDSVVFVVKGTPLLIRRSKGFVPVPFLLKTRVPRHIFASGGDLKNTFALAKEKVIVLSQYLGDLESAVTQRVYNRAVHHFLKIFDIRPEVFVSDMHPKYFTTRLTDELASTLHRDCNYERLFVQHHHAHAVSVMLEYEIDEPVIALCFDGTGFGLDSKIWGGEFLVVERGGFFRVGHFSYFRLPGSEKAIKQVWRIGLSLLWQIKREGEYLSLWETKGQNLSLVLQLLEKGINSPYVCSVGRLFDGVSAILGVSDEVSTEAEAAQKLEEVALGSQTYFEIPLKIKEEEVKNLKEVLWGEERFKSSVPEVFKKNPKNFVISVDDLVEAVLELKTQGKGIPEIALSFHKALVKASSQVVSLISETFGIKKVVFSGGAFQNRILLKELWDTLEEKGYQVFVPKKVPLNDGGISLGQIGVALRILHQKGCK